MNRRSVFGRFSVTAVIVLALPAFAAAQHHGGGGFAGPAVASRPATMIARSAPAPMHAAVNGHAAPQSAGRMGAPMLRARNGVHTNRPANNGHFDNGNSNNGNLNSGNFDGDGFNGTDFQNVPGLGFDYPHLAAISGNRRHNGRFNGDVPFGFGGFLLGPSVVEVPVPESQAQDAQSSAPDEQQVAEDAPPAQPAPRRSRSSRPAEPPAAVDSAPAPPREDEQYVFVRRDGSLVFAVAYAWDSGTLRYITPDGLRRSIGRDALDLGATQQFNEQRGLNFHAPA